jgi:hypothetical protein
MDEKKGKKIHQIGNAVRTYRDDHLERKIQIIKDPVNLSQEKVQPDRSIKTSRTYGPGHTVKSNRTSGTGRKIEPNPTKFNKSMISTRPVHKTAPGNASPNRYKLPKSDSNEESLERTSDSTQAPRQGGSLPNVRKQSIGTSIQSSKIKKTKQSTSSRKTTSERP